MKKKQYKEKTKTKASKEQLLKFKECFEEYRQNQNKEKIQKTIINLNEKNDYKN